MPHKRVFKKKPDLQTESFVTRADIGQERGKSKKGTSRKTWKQCALRLFSLQCCCRFQVRNKTVSRQLKRLNKLVSLSMFVGI